MENLIHADIFFFISSIGFVLVAGLLVVGLVHVLRILRAVSRITDMLEKNADLIGEEATEFIQDIRQSRIYRMFFGSPKRRKK